MGNVTHFILASVVDELLAGIKLGGGGAGQALPQTRCKCAMLLQCDVCIVPQENSLEVVSIEPLAHSSFLCTLR